MARSGEFDAGVYDSFHAIATLARDLNTQLAVPEIVLIGRNSHGKSQLVEALLGLPVGKDTQWASRRPVHVSVINNPDFDTPRITVKRDAALPDFGDVTVSPDKLSAEIAKRSATFSRVPIYVNFESKSCWNINFIDTPDLLDEKEKSDVDPAQVQETVFHIASKQHRTLICVEEAKDWNELKLANHIKKVDPKWERTLFVYTNLHALLSSFTSTRELNRFLSSVQAKSFFVTLSGEGLEKAYQQDMEALEQLQFDKRYDSSIGIHKLRKHILELTWKKYQENVPEVLKRLRQFKRNSEEELTNVRSQLANLDPYRLRSTASNYVMEFLQGVEKLIVGTLEGNPAQNGQTLEEELNQEGGWYNWEHRPVDFDPAEMEVPYWDSKLYGGQQFERLLAEFKAVSESAKLPDLTQDDVATAAGPNKLNNTANFAWAASDLAQRATHRVFTPLIEQLFKRAIYIMKRLTEIVEKMIENKKKQQRRAAAGPSSARRGLGGRSGGATPAGVPQQGPNLDDFPFFTHSVKDLFYKFVDETAETCKEKALDEFYCTRLVYWELTALDPTDFKIPAENAPAQETYAAVAKLTTQLFNDIRRRITKNVMLKCYNYFLVPMQTDLWGEIQGKITVMSDEMLEELFEVAATKDKFKDSESHLQSILDKFGEQESSFMHAANTFSHLKFTDVGF